IGAVMRSPARARSIAPRSEPTMMIRRGASAYGEDANGRKSSHNVTPHWARPADGRRSARKSLPSRLLEMQESRTIRRRIASTVALAFFVLPKHKRDGMSALYAFCREVDEIAGNEAVPLE